MKIITTTIPTEKIRSERYCGYNVELFFVRAAEPFYQALVRKDDQPFDELGGKYDSAREAVLRTEEKINDAERNLTAEIRAACATKQHGGIK